MKFSSHVKTKLSFYMIAEDEITEALKEPQLECNDVVENSKIFIIMLRDRPFVVVASIDKETIITAYPTDKQTILNRRRSGRWICK